MAARTFPLFPVLITAYCTGYYAMTLFPSPRVVALYAGIGCLCWAFALRSVGVRRLLFPGILAGTAIVTYATQRVPLEQAFTGFVRLAEVFPMVMFTPVIALIYERRNYIREIVRVISRRVKRNWQVYGSLALVSNALAGTMGSGSVIVLYRLLVTRERVAESLDRFLGTAILRGFGAARFWTPNSPAYPVVVQFLQAPLLPTMAVGMCLSAFAIALAVVYNAVVTRRRALSGENGRSAALSGLQVLEALAAAAAGEEAGSGEEATGEPVSRRNRESERKLPATEAVATAEEQEQASIAEFIVVTGGFLALVVFLGPRVPLKLPAVIPLFALMFTFGFFSSRREFSVAREGLRRLWFSIDRRRYESGVLLSAGLFIASLEDTALGRQFMALYQDFLSSVGISELLAIGLIMMGVSMIGLPPMPLAILLSSTLDPATLQTSSILLTLAIMGGAGISATMAPVAMPSMMLSALMGRSPLTVGFLWNWRYSLLLFVDTQLLLHMLARWIIP